MNKGFREKENIVDSQLRIVLPENDEAKLLLEKLISSASLFLRDSLEGNNAGGNKDVK